MWGNPNDKHGQAGRDKKGKAARGLTSANRERRQDRIRELTERLEADAARHAEAAAGRDGILGGKRARDAASQSAASSVSGSGARLSGRKPHETLPSAGRPGGRASGQDGPYGTRIYRQGAPAEWEQPLGSGWPDEAWPQAQEKDPEAEWKNSANPWERLEQASGELTGLAPRTLREGGSGSRAGTGGGGGDRSGPGTGGRFARSFARRLLVSAALFGAVWGLFQLDGPAARQGQLAVRQALSEPMDVSAIAVWYEGVFGAPPSFLPGFDKSGGTRPAAAPAERATVAPVAGGSIVHPFAELLGGVEISGAPGADVLAAEEGRVLVVSADDAKGPTVVLQHAGGRTTYYGRLGETVVAPNDWVQAGETIGRLGSAAEGSAGALLYFAVKEQDRYLDPADVIPLD
ncbi:M23 family metallopeptidase [Paenibacillus albicereus]|uniref:M23 family metallopeptidase n=1 Tax=Paenibacillus albicereus TaxID=2726185 RepID=A0A6H2GZW9_9BACL|nr:M23 family metallopeptidase [Paenibacillus albicereus]QJC52889.1 M23 family metallopeptidase [Paenibacillus albicereus]